MTKLTDTTIFPASSSEAGQRCCTIAGLPLLPAIVYASLFAVAFWFYSTVWPSAPIMVSDSSSYLAAAQDLSDLHIDQLHSRAPGYPLLLVLTASGESPSRELFFVSLLLHFGSIWLLASILHHAGLKESMLNVFGSLLLLPPYVAPAAYVLSETIAEAALVAALTSIVFWFLNKRIIWIILAALAVGYAGLTRPTYQVLALAMAGYMVVTKYLFDWLRLRWIDVIKATTILIFGSFVLLGSYAFTNYHNFGYFGLVSPRLGLSLSTKTWRFVERLPDEYTPVREVLIRARNAQLVEEGGDHDGSMSIWAAVPELTKVTGLEYPQLSDYMLKLNLLLIKNAPLYYLREVVWASGTYLFPSSTRLANFNSRPVQFLWAALHFFIIVAFAFILVIFIGRATLIHVFTKYMARDNPDLVSEFKLVHMQAFIYGLAGTIVVYTGAISCLIEVGDPRYRAPTDSLIILMVFLGANLSQRLLKFCRT